MRTNNNKFQTTLSELFANIDQQTNSKQASSYLAKVVDIPNNGVIGQIAFIVPGIDNQNSDSWLAIPKNPNSFVKPAIGSWIHIEVVQDQYFYISILNYSDTDNLDIIEKYLSQVATQTSVDTSTDEYDATINSGGPVEAENNSTFVDYSSEVVPIKEKEGDNIIKGFHNNDLIFSYDDLGNSITGIFINRDTENYDINTQGISIYGNFDVDSEQQFPDGFSSNKPLESEGSALNIKTDKVRISSDAGSIFLSSGANTTIASAQDINIDTQTKTTINSPEIFLGTGAKEPLVLGNKYDALLNELVDAILAMTVGTPTGPSSPPINAASFTKIKAKIKSTLSAVNKTK